MTATTVVHEAEPNWRTRFQSQVVRVEGEVRQPNSDGVDVAGRRRGLLGAA